MSVLIEAATLVVRRSRFDALYPGGATAFLRSVNELTTPPRFACADDPHLLNLSFDTPEHAAPAMGLLKLAGLRGLDNSIPQAVDYALVDQDFTPLPGFSWLSWSKHEDGFTFAWDPAHDVGAVAGPAEWMRERSDGVERGVVGDESDHLLLLASEFGVKSYLDFRTGAVTQVDGRNTAHETTIGRKENGQWGEIYAPGAQDERFGGPLGRLIWCALEELGWRTVEYCRPGLIVEYASQVATYRCLFAAAESARGISCSVQAPLVVPRKDRRRLMEFITRINVGMVLGAFDLNLDTGVLVFRSGAPLGDDDPSPAIVRDIALVGVAMFDRFFPSMLEVMTGKRSVIETVLHQPSSRDRTTD